MDVNFHPLLESSADMIQGGRMEEVLGISSPKVFVIKNWNLCRMLREVEMIVEALEFQKTFETFDLCKNASTFCF